MTASREVLTPFEAAIKSLAAPGSALTDSTTESSRILLADAQQERAMNADPDIGGMTKDYSKNAGTVAPAQTGSSPTQSGKNSVRTQAVKKFADDTPAAREARRKAFWDKAK